MTCDQRECEIYECRYWKEPDASRYSKTFPSSRYYYTELSWLSEFHEAFVSASCFPGDLTLTVEHLVLWVL